MNDHKSRPGTLGRRGLFVRLIQTVHLAMGATLAFVLGRAVLSPAFAKREALWLHAGDLKVLPDGEPVPVTLRIARPDGASEVVDRRVIYLVKTGDRDVRALRFDLHAPRVPDASSIPRRQAHRMSVSRRRLRPAAAQVVAGPPPAPLAPLSTRLEGDQILVEV